MGPAEHLAHVLQRGHLALRGVDLVEDWGQPDANGALGRARGSSTSRRCSAVVPVALALAWPIRLEGPSWIWYRHRAQESRMATTGAHKVELVYEVLDHDERWLLEEDTMPESALHDAILELLSLILKAWLRRTARAGQVGRNLAVRWDKTRTNVGVDPDLCLLDPAPPEESATSLCTWLPGHHPPRVALEVVSEGTARKDYEDNPERYAASRTQELWIFDPLALGPALRGDPRAAGLAP